MHVNRSSPGWIIFKARFFKSGFSEQILKKTVGGNPILKLTAVVGVRVSAIPLEMVEGLTENGEIAPRPL